MNGKRPNDDKLYDLIRGESEPAALKALRNARNTELAESERDAAWEHYQLLKVAMKKREIVAQAKAFLANSGGMNRAYFTHDDLDDSLAWTFIRRAAHGDPSDVQTYGPIVLETGDQKVKLG